MKFIIPAQHTQKQTTWTLLKKGSWLAGAEPAGCLTVCGHTLCRNWLDIYVDVSNLGILIGQCNKVDCSDLILFGILC